MIGLKEIAQVVGGCYDREVSVKFPSRHMKALPKYDASPTRIMEDDILYFDCVHFNIWMETTYFTPVMETLMASVPSGA